MITDPSIEQYLHDLLPPRDEVLADMEAYAAEHQIPIVGLVVAHFLASLALLL